MLALACEEFEVLGLTTVFGNVPVEKSTENALRLVDLAGRPDILVAQGAARSWKMPYKGAKAAVHGEDGQGNTFLPPSPLKPLEIPAAEFIVQQVLQYPGAVVIAALGPLTNLADALKLDPQIQQKVKGVVFMGGNPLTPGNASPTAEANVQSDPEAADFVMAHSWPITMVGLEVTQNTILTTSDIDELAALPSQLAKQVFQAYRHYLKFYREVNHMDGTWMHDSSVFTYLLRPDLYQVLQAPIRVETADCLSRGKTWPSLKNYGYNIKDKENPWANRPKINICVDVDGEAVVSLLKERLLSAEFSG